MKMVVVMMMSMMMMICVKNAVTVCNQWYILAKYVIVSVQLEQQ